MKPVIYCYSLSEADIWAFEYGYTRVNVNDPASGSFYVIETAAESAEIEYGRSFDTEAEIFPMIGGVTVRWESSDIAVATVDSGVITGVAPGTAEITVTVGQVTKTIPVRVYGPARSFTVEPNEMYLICLTTGRLWTGNVQPAGADLTVTWSSSSERVAKVAQDGTVTALRAGTAVITAASDHGVTASCTVHVCMPVTGIRFARERYEVPVGGSARLTALVTTETETLENRLVSFTSSDESIITVDGNGTVTALGTGTVTVTASDGNGMTATCTVTAREPVVTVLPTYMTRIEEEAFAGSALEAVIIPAECESIGSRAFADCPGLVYVSIPAGVTFIADDAFEGSVHVIIEYTAN